ncbi:MAG: glycosyltransferase family 4 protein [Candidatus Diapherotrites archaeon]|nr:glycosyltransferase family 4 protein [Candidatus Diapherotrites archaeon]
MARICRIVDFFPSEKEILGDLGPNYHYYSKGTTDAGFEEHVICTRGKGQPEFEEVGKVKVHRVAPSYVKHARRSLLWGAFAKNSLAKALELKPDLLVGHNALHFWPALHKKQLEKRDIRLLTHLHGWVDFIFFAEHFPWLESPSIAFRDRAMDFSFFCQFLPVVLNADFIVACDNSTKLDVQKYAGGKPVEVVYNGVDLDVFKPMKSNVKEGLGAERLLLNVSRPVPWKGLQYLINAMPLINREFDDAKLLLLGFRRDDYKPYTAWLERLAERRGLSNVVFGGKVPYFDLPKYYSAADCFVAPSYPDPSPKTVYEAQACNTPVAGVNGAGIPEIFGPESGLLFEKRNPEDLAAKVIEILEKPRSFRNGRETVEKKATWKNCVKSLVGAYEKALAMP